MNISIKAKLDVKGSETLPHWHYTIGKIGDAVSGGFYIRKDAVNPPDEINIVVPDPKKGE